MTVRFYQSTDASAPVLTGQAGSLVALLDACLIAGYGAKTAAGWSTAYTASNKRAYRMGTTGNTGFYLNVDDSGGGSGGAREAFMTGYQTMSDLATGTGQFPTSAQITLGSAPIGALVCRKSTTADATARKWYLVADESCFHLFVETGDFSVNPRCVLGFSFGDFYSMNGTSDLYRCMIIGRNNQNTGIAGHEALTALTNSLTAIQGGHYVAAHANGIGTSIACGKHVDMVKFAGSGSYVATSGTGNFGSGVNTAYSVPTAGTSGAGLAYPSPVDGAVYMLPFWVNHTSVLRGRMKGLWCPMQSQVFNNGDTFNGTGDQTGKSFLALAQPTPTAGTPVPSWGNIYIETSDTWS